MGNVSDGPEPHVSRDVEGGVLIRGCESVTEDPGAPVVSGFRLKVRVVCIRAGFAGLRCDRVRVGGLALGVDVA